MHDLFKYPWVRIPLIFFLGLCVVTMTLFMGGMCILLIAFVVELIPPSIIFSALIILFIVMIVYWVGDTIYEQFFNIGYDKESK